MKKLLSILLAAALLIGLLTACGKPEPAEIPPVSSSSNSQTAEEFRQSITSSKSSTSSSKTTNPISSGKYCGSKNSDVFHYPSCSSAERIKDANLVWFKDLDAAYDRGYRPCKRCTPD